MKTLPTLRRLLIAAILVSQSSIALARNNVDSKSHEPCPPVSGNITLEEYQLYPENADWDSEQCLLYFGALYNGTIAVYDPYKAEIVQIIELPNNLSYDPLVHTGGVDYDARTGLISLVASAAPPFYTRGNDTTGPNFVYVYDPSKKTFEQTIDLNAAVTHGNYTGFQDAAHDPRGNMYVVGTYSASIIRITPDGRDVKTWYVQEPVNTTRGGFSGIASTGNTLLVGDKNGGNGGRIVRFDSRNETGVPYYVPVNRPINSTLNTTLPTSDAIYLPPKYNDTVLLMAQQVAGTAVMVSKDGKWDAAEFKGYVPVPTEGAANGSQVTANVQMAQSIYTVHVWFDWPPNGSLAGNRTTFPMIDITKEVDVLVGL